MINNKRWYVIPLLMLLLSGSSTYLYQLSEIDGDDYAFLTNMYREGGDEFRREIDAAQYTRVSKWQFVALRKAFWQSSNALSIPTIQPREQNIERDRFIAAVKEKEHRPIAKQNVNVRSN